MKGAVCEDSEPFFCFYANSIAGFPISDGNGREGLDGFRLGDLMKMANYSAYA
jgi:hypothetical protein